MSEAHWIGFYMDGITLCLGAMLLAALYGVAIIIRATLEVRREDNQMIKHFREMGYN